MTKRESVVLRLCVKNYVEDEKNTSYISLFRLYFFNDILMIYLFSFCKNVLQNDKPSYALLKLHYLKSVYRISRKSTIPQDLFSLLFSCMTLKTLFGRKNITVSTFSAFRKTSLEIVIFNSAALFKRTTQPIQL